MQIDLIGPEICTAISALRAAAATATEQAFSAPAGCERNVLLAEAEHYSACARTLMRREAAAREGRPGPIAMASGTAIPGNWVPV